VSKVTFQLLLIVNLWKLTKLEHGSVLLSLKKTETSLGVLVKVAVLPISEHGAGVGIYNEPLQDIESPVCVVRMTL
jgi:hypothetical protein